MGLQDLSEQRAAPWRGKYRLYWASRPAPDRITGEQLGTLEPMHFRTLRGALQAAAQLLRQNDFAWCIERPEGRRLGAAEIRRHCAELLKR